MLKTTLALLTAATLIAAPVAAQQAFSSASTGWSGNSSFTTFGGGSHSYGGFSFAGTGSYANANDGSFFGLTPDTSESAAWSLSGGFGAGTASTSSGLSQTSMEFTGFAESGAQAAD